MFAEQAGVPTFCSGSEEGAAERGLPDDSAAPSAEEGQAAGLEDWGPGASGENLGLRGPVGP